VTDRDVHTVNINVRRTANVFAVTKVSQTENVTDKNLLDEIFKYP